MKKILSLILGVLALLAAVINGYLLFFKADKSSETAATGSSAPSQVASSSEAMAASSTEASSSEAAETSGQYVDGTYTGAVTSTNRGDYQVQVTVEGGQMTDIQVILFPDGNEMSQQINGTNLPIYTAEALSNQSAEVTQISGASEAFKGFTGSLQDALNQANG